MCIVLILAVSVTGNLLPSEEDSNPIDSKVNIGPEVVCSGGVEPKGALITFIARRYGPVVLKTIIYKTASDIATGLFSSEVSVVISPNEEPVSAKTQEPVRSKKEAEKQAASQLLEMLSAIPSDEQQRVVNKQGSFLCI